MPRLVRSLLAALCASLALARAARADLPPTATAAITERVHDLGFASPEAAEREAVDAPEPRPEEGLARHAPGGGALDEAEGGLLLAPAPRPGGVIISSGDPGFLAGEVLAAAGDLQIGAGEGESLSLEGERLTARLAAPSHAALDALLAGLRARLDRRIALSLELLALPALDPLLDPSRAPGAPAPAAERARALSSGTVLWAARRSVRAGRPVRLALLRSESYVARLVLGNGGIVPVSTPRVEALSMGVEGTLRASVAPGGAGVRVALRLAERSLDGRDTRSLAGAEIDLLTAGGRDVAACLDVAPGETALLSLGPAFGPGALEGAGPHRVLLVTARLEPEAKAGPALLPAAGGAPPDEALVLERSIFAGGLARSVVEERPAEPLLLLLQDAEREAGADAIRMLRPVGAGLLAWAAPASMRRLEGTLARLRSFEPVPVAVEATIALVGEEDAAAREVARALLEGPALATATARALLGRAARGEGMLRAAALAGAALEGGSAAFRSRVERAFVAGVDSLAGGVEGRVEVARAPRIEAAESGASLVARLGPAPEGRLSLEVSGDVQVVDLSRRASASLPPWGEVAVALPSVARAPFGGRLELPREGGAAIFSAGRLPSSGGGPGRLCVVIVRVAR